MKLISLLYAALAAPLAIAAPPSKPYSQWAADSFIAKGVSKDKSYTFPTLYRGFELVYAATGSTVYSKWLATQIDAVLTTKTSGELTGWNFGRSHLDDIRIGSSILDQYARTKDAKYKKAADFLRGRLDLHARTQGGGFWHKDPEYKNQMWLDGLFMASPFYAQYTALFQPGNTSAWDDIVRQFGQIEAHTRNRTTGLLTHGFDESKSKVWADPVTGSCPHVWSRAVGWYVMALLDVLDYLPSSHAGYAELKDYFVTLAAGLVKTQDPATGGWWLIMDEPYPGKQGNYIESSATAIFTYGFLKGIRKGFISAAQYEAPARKAYKLMLDKFALQTGANGTLNWEGTVSVGSLSGDGSYEYYIAQKIQQNDYKGAGPFIYASVELEAMDKKTRR